MRGSPSTRREVREPGRSEEGREVHRRWDRSREESRGVVENRSTGRGWRWRQEAREREERLWSSLRARGATDSRRGKAASWREDREGR